MSEERMCWSVDEENFCHGSLGDLIDGEGDLEVGRTVYVGEAILPTNSQLCDADDVISTMADRAYDIAGEYADNYPDVTKEAAQELNALLSAWIEKHCPPSFYTVKNVKPYVLTEDDLA